MKNHKEIRSIVIVQTAFLGDVILTTPLIRAAQELFPLADVDVVAIPQTADILRNNPFIRTLYTFDKRADKRKAFMRAVQWLRKQKYDLGFAPHRSMTTAQLLLLGKVERRIGFAGNAASWLYTDRIYFDVEKPQVKRYLDLLKPLTSRNFSHQTEVFFDAAVKSKVNAMLELYRTPYKIAVAPGSVWPTKRWPAEKYVELLRRLERHPITFIFIGSAEERDYCQKIINLSGVGNAVNLAGSCSLTEAAAAIASCDLLIANDNGAMHMANAVKTDVFAFFGPTVPRFGFAPFRENDRIFQVDLDCRPCSTHGGKSCPKGHFKCMRDIRPIDVVRAVEYQLELDA
ncbi:MAG: lipopolysaccharide heptosyltransferase II [candidate division KSB1 bacterium]|nr:lipopolysaccharide heptosyltransferase II [candidate division KSB1 bacterium]